jgi:hypothetical protein
LIPFFKTIATGLLDLSAKLDEEEFWLFDIVEDCFGFIDIILMVDAEQLEPL